MVMEGDMGGRGKWGKRERKKKMYCPISRADKRENIQTQTQGQGPSSGQINFFSYFLLIFYSYA